MTNIHVIPTPLNNITASTPYISQINPIVKAPKELNIAIPP